MMRMIRFRFISDFRQSGAPWRHTSESKYPAAMANAYGTWTRVFAAATGVCAYTASWNMWATAASAVRSWPAHAAKMSESRPPLAKVSSTKGIHPGNPSTAPIAAMNFTSPPPNQPTANNGTRTTSTQSIPKSADASEPQPVVARHAKPSAAREMTSQFGIFAYRRSVKTARQQAPPMRTSPPYAIVTSLWNRTARVQQPRDVLSKMHNGRYRDRRYECNDDGILNERPSPLVECQANDAAHAKIRYANLSRQRLARCSSLHCSAPNLRSGRAI